ncbi:hypothetical protein J2D73_17280 [Acetobacter sacchari]|uniref:Uncharacterized protein n=1 Tax=Acetobacter sacchari TaxID=2661687 RepID=A0ABS3M031_9PROT|nr:hypothetical protein [Acetobacter sacchari]MBO1361541.1 hypothetical protein [Acetobacter sacchari]
MMAEIDVRTVYPNRFYASCDLLAAQPAPVTGWWDAWGMSDPAVAPPVADLVPLTADQWNGRLTGGWGVQGGALVAMTEEQLADAVPLAVRAGFALTAAQNVVWAEYGSLGDAVPGAWISYQKALKAIVDGSDTASTTLPASPAGGSDAG